MSNSIFWIPCFAFILHVAEEYPFFPAWATRHFGVTSRAYYVYSHILLITANLAICNQAAHSIHTSSWPILAASIQWILCTNGLFHLGATLAFREYSPGVVTGVLVLIPATVHVFSRIVERGILSISELLVAVVIGSVASALIIASLWLNMNLDWKLRRIS